MARRSREVYASLPAERREPPKRLVGWSKIDLAAGESKPVSVEVPAQYLSIFDEKNNGWQLVPGEYTIHGWRIVAGSATASVRDPALTRRRLLLK